MKVNELNDGETALHVAVAAGNSIVTPSTGAEYRLIESRNDMANMKRLTYILHLQGMKNLHGC